MSALLNGLLLSAPLTVLVWVTLWVVPRRVLNAATRHAIWWAVVVVVVGLPLLFVRGAGSSMPLRGVVEPPPLLAGLADVDEREVAVAVEVEEASDEGAVSPVRVTEGAWIAWVMGGWGLVSGLLLVRLLLSYRTLEGYKARATPRHGFRSSTEIAVPMAAGPWNRCILIPAVLLDQIPEVEIDQIVRHESAHLARRDDVGLLVQRILEALFPWHPVLRFATHQLSFEREVACDDFVIATVDARSYATSLTHLAELAQKGLLAANAVGGSSLVRRVDLLFDKRRHTGTRMLRARFGVGVAALMVCCSVAARVPRLISFEPPPLLAGLDRIEVPAPPPLPVRELIAQVAPAAPKVVAAPELPTAVIVPVTVTEQRGRAVVGLSRENFELYDNGVRQEIAGFSEMPEAVSAAIVLDASEGSLAFGLGGILDFTGGRPETEVFLTSLRALRAPLPANIESISGTPADLPDAILLAGQRLQRAQHAERHIWVLSELGERSLGAMKDQLIAAAAAARAHVHAILVSSPGTPVESADELKDLTERTGGTFDLIEDPAGLRNVLARRLIAYRSQYRLEFVPQGPQGQGYHDLVVRVGMPNLTVRARGGYWVP